MKDKPNKITTVLKVIVTGEFYDDDSTEETLRYAVEQDLEDAGFDVDVAILKEQVSVKPKKADNPEESEYCCGICGYPLWLDELYCAHCGRRIEWEGQ